MGVLPSYDFYWVTRPDTLFVALDAPTTGWVGLGIGEAGGMRGADIMIGSVHDTTGVATVGDFHGTQNGVPVKDGCQDWTIHHGEQADGRTLIVASRKFITNDKNDRPIVPVGLRAAGLLFAYGPSNCDTVGLGCYHTTNRAKHFIDLSKGSGGSKADFVTRLGMNPGYSYIDLRFNAATPTAASDVDFRTPAVGGREQLDPSKRTAYWEYCFPRSAHSEWSQHDTKTLVGFNGILDSGATRNDLVHHAVVYAYPADDCTGQPTIIWVGGVGFFDELPADVGMSFSRFKAFRIQVHYDNPNLESGLQDNSGVRIWLDANARTHEAGVLQLGDPAVKLSADGKQTISPGHSYFEFKCPASATANWHEITVFGQILHMHATGDAMYLEIKDSNGVSKRPNAVEYFDFGWQDPTLGQPFQIKPGDELTTRCYFHNKGNTDVVFGQGSDQEMCIDFIYYYPMLTTSALKPTEFCGFATSQNYDGFRPRLKLHR
eukprot:g4180.t1